MPAGQGAGVLVSVTVAGQEAAAPLVARYASPSVSSVDHSPLETKGNGVIMLLGDNFGPAPNLHGAQFAPPTVTVGGRNCPVMAGYTYRSISCTFPPGEGTNLPIVVTAANQSSATSAGAGAVTVSYFAPSVASLSVQTGPTTGAGVTLVVTGANFGLAPSVRFVSRATGAPASAVAAFSQLQSVSADHTQHVLALPEGAGAGLGLVVTAGGQTSDPNAPGAAFAYAAPTLLGGTSRRDRSAESCALTTTSIARALDGVIVNRTSVGNCFPTVGGFEVVVQGVNLGPAFANVSVSVGGLPCAPVLAHTHTSVTCVVPVGMGDRNALTAVVAGQASQAPLPVGAPRPAPGSAAAANFAPLFAFDPPVVTNIIPNVPDGFGDRLTISGRVHLLNFRPGQRAHRLTHPSCAPLHPQVQFRARQLISEHPRRRRAVPRRALGQRLGAALHDDGRARRSQEPVHFSRGPRRALRVGRGGGDAHLRLQVRQLRPRWRDVRRLREAGAGRRLPGRRARS
jgi:hypothetical protein